MKQPELGKKLNEIRIQKGITQKELSDLCSVDIRTIQRIEAGEVEPRMSTLKILAAALETDDILINQQNQFTQNTQFKNAMLVSLIAGIIYFFNFILYSIVLPKYTSISGGPVLTLFSIIHILSGGILFLGFVMIGKKYRKWMVVLSSILVIVLIPTFVIVETIARITGNQTFVYLIWVTVFIIGISGVLFGVGLIQIGNSGRLIFTIAGIVQLAQNIMFVIPVLSLQYIGLWLAVPANFILLLVLFSELKVSQQ